MKLTSIILAAGYSSRMGSDKAFLKINDKTVLNTIIDKLMPISQNIVIVGGNNYKIMKKNFVQHGLSFVHNTSPERGMFFSLKLIAMKNLPGTHFLIHLIDQPFIKNSTYRKLAFAMDKQHLVFMPTIEAQKRSGHPIIITKTVLKIIKKAPFSSNLKQVIKSLPPEALLHVPVDDMNILDNINTPEQFADKINAKG